MSQLPSRRKSSQHTATTISSIACRKSGNADSVEHPRNSDFGSCNPHSRPTLFNGMCNFRHPRLRLTHLLAHSPQIHSTNLEKGKNPRSWKDQEKHGRANRPAPLFSANSGRHTSRLRERWFVGLDCTEVSNYNFAYAVDAIVSPGSRCYIYP